MKESWKNHERMMKKSWKNHERIMKEYNMCFSNESIWHDMKVDMSWVWQNRQRPMRRCVFPTSCNAKISSCGWSRWAKVKEDKLHELPHVAFLTNKYGEAKQKWRKHDMNTTWTWHEHDMCRNGREMCRRVNNGTVWQCMAHQIWSNTVKWIVFVVKIFSCGTESQGTIRKSSLFGSPEEFYRCVFRRAKGVLILACQGRRYFEAERLVRTAIIIYFDCRFETALTTKQFRKWALVSGNLRSFCISCLKFDQFVEETPGLPSLTGRRKHGL